MASKALIRDWALRRAFASFSFQRISSLKFSTSNRLSVSSGDKIELFTNPEVQSLLKRLTGRDFERVFRQRKIGQKIREPRYSFMTERELEDSLKRAEENADKLLQFPPVLRPRSKREAVLSFDPELQGTETSTIILTDITPNVKDRDRIIVARDPDGTLREATWEERDKMNMTYFPKEGKEYKEPKVFADPKAFQDVLERASPEDNTYEFVLDRACLQYEPDDEKFIDICEKTYQAVDRRGNYDMLKSTRHYGPMVFYFVRTRGMDNLLQHSIRQQRVETDAVWLVDLFHVLFPGSKSAKSNNKDALTKLRNYIELDSIRKSDLQLEINSYEESVRKKAEFTEDLGKAHGVNR